MSSLPRDPPVAVAEAIATADGHTEQADVASIASSLVAVAITEQASPSLNEAAQDMNHRDAKQDKDKQANAEQDENSQDEDGQDEDSQDEDSQDEDEQQKGRGGNVSEPADENRSIKVPLTQAKRKSKKKKKGKSTEARGPTALPPFRGTGCEGQRALASYLARYGLSELLTS